MKISERYGLNKSQAQLDFVDIDPSMDTPLFLDPFFLSKRRDRWSFEASNTIRDFFQRGVYQIIRIYGKCRWHRHFEIIGSHSFIGLNGEMQNLSIP